MRTACYIQASHLFLFSDLQDKVARSAIVLTFTIFKKPHCANFKTHIVQISESVHLEHGFATLHLVSVSQNVNISPFQQNITDRRTDGRTDRRTRFTHRYP